MKKIFAVLPILALTCSVNANAGFLDGLTKVLNTTGGILNTATGQTSSTSSNNAHKPVPMAQLTPAQEQRITQVVRANTGDNDLNRAITEAKPNIEGIMRLASCQTDGNFLMAGRFLAPTASDYNVLAIIPQMKYQPLNHCLTVSSIGNWKIESRSRLDYHQVDKIRFSIAYASDITPESNKADVHMQREPDGQWYVTYHR